MREFNDIAVKQKFDAYPVDVKPFMFELREVIFSVAQKYQLDTPGEALKWNEPAYLSKHGSTIRIDWKKGTPERLFIFFNCRTILIETFRELFPQGFEYHGNRAISLPLMTPIHTRELEACLLMAMRYHRIKNKPLLNYGR